MRRTIIDILYTNQDLDDDSTDVFGREMVTLKNLMDSTDSRNDDNVTAMYNDDSTTAIMSGKTSEKKSLSLQIDAATTSVTSSRGNPRRTAAEEPAQLNLTVVRILFTLWVLGVCFGLIGTYEFMLLREFGVRTDFMGICRFVGVICEAPLWYYSSELLDKLGIRNTQLLALFGNGLRLAAFGHVTSGYQVLYMEWTHGFMFAVPYSTISVFTARIACETTKGTVQSLIFTLFVGIGAGSGIVIGGLSIDYLFDKNIQALFRAAGFSALAVSSAIFMYDYSSKIGAKLAKIIRRWC